MLAIPLFGLPDNDTAITVTYHELRVEDFEETLVEMAVCQLL